MCLSPLLSVSPLLPAAIITLMDLTWSSSACLAFCFDPQYFTLPLTFCGYTFLPVVFLDLALFARENILICTS